MKKAIKLNFIQLSILVIIPSIIMAIISGCIVYNTNKNYLTNDKHISEFIETYNKLLDEYYEDLDKNKLIDAAIGGMLEYTGDDYTIYMDEDATNTLNEKLGGTYEGIGIKITLNDDGEIYVVEVFDESPAQLAGIEVNDILISINGVSLEGKDTKEATLIIQESEESIVNIEVKRKDELKSFDVERKTLIVPIVSSSIKEVNGKKIGYIYLETFSSTADTQVESTLISMENDGIDSLIIDLRDNTGGYLTSCTRILEMFLEKDKLMYTIKSKKTSEDFFDSTEEKKDYPIVVLINGATASASEILASALKYSYGATIVGTKSFGKGKVQNTGTLEDGTMIKYTTSRWFTPNGDCIDEIGLKPDIEVELSQEYLDERIEENDNQLNEAIKVLTK